MIAVIMMLSAAMAVPLFLRSYRSAQLRTSVRSIVMASRYARGVAVLEQQHTAILFDLETSSIEVVATAAQAGASERSQFLEGRDEAASDVEPEEEAEASSYGVNSRVKRYLAEDVKILSVKTESESQEYDGIFWVNYFPNGMCDEYTVQLRDAKNKTATVQIDPLSGRASVEYD
jgi:hypothetical protein